MFYIAHFLLEFIIPWCESVDYLTSVDNRINVENETTNHRVNNFENLTDSDILECIADNITCIYKNQTVELDDFGLELMDILPNDFPEAFHEHEDVNITQEKQYFLELIEQTNAAEMHKDQDEHERNTKSPNEDHTEDDLIPEMLAEFSKYLEKSGKRGLKTLAYKVKNLVNPTLYLNHILKSPKYFDEFEKHFKFLLNKKIQCEIDQQFIILDMLESSVRIFGEASKEICGAIVQESNITLSVDEIGAIEEAIGLAVFVEKKEAFNYICQNTYVCRHFPAYSDYVAKLLKSILQNLDGNYFNTVVDVVEVTIKDKTEFLRSIMDDKMAHKFILQSVPITNNPAEVISLMNNIMKIIKQRYKAFYPNGVEIRNSSKAVRILIDIIDISFLIPNQDILRSDFRDLTKYIIDWGHGKKLDMERMLSNFLNDAVDFIDFFWNDDIKEEVKNLIQFIINGNSDNEVLLDILFTNGSRLGTETHSIYTEKEEELNAI